jgi:hypothetical protein
LRVTKAPYAIMTNNTITTPQSIHCRFMFPDLAQTYQSLF